MTSNDWQNRLLTDDELQRTLANLGALEGMQVLQRQLELRTAAHEKPSEIRAEVSNQLDLGLTDVVPMVLDNDGIHPVESTSAPVSQPAAPAMPSTDTDIVNNLNALFAPKPAEQAQPKANDPVVTPVAPMPVISQIDAPTPVADQTLASPISPSPQVDYLPKPVESNTDSVFIPTFANPLPKPGAVTASAPAASHPQGDQSSANGEAEHPTAEVPAVSPQASLQLPEWQGAAEGSADIPSAEEAITAFEELNTVNAPLPTLVDDVILSVGGVEDAEESAVATEGPVPIYATEPEERVQEPIKLAKAAGSGIGYLIASWNGTGSLIFLIAAGFVAGMMKFSLLTVIAGSFGALAITGLGFGTAAVTARRGRQPQATISRAVFGVVGASVPLVAVTIARYAATAVAAIGSVIAVTWYFPGLPATVPVSGVNLDMFYVLLGGLLLLAALATMFSAGARRAVILVMAFASIAWIALAIGLAAVLKPGILTLGSINAQQALTLASVLLILISLIWGTTAADETPNLRSNIQSIKLIAAGLLANSIIGTAAVAAGYSYFHLDLAGLKNTSMGVVLAIALVFALSHQVRRTADSFGGFGLVGTRWWVVVGSLAIIVGGVVVLHAFVPENLLLSSVLSLLPVAGVPVIAWLASYGIDAILRREDYHEVSLLRDYGFYGKVRLANLLGWILATAAGFGFIDSTVPGFGWLGYLARPLGISTSGLDAAMGVWVAFAIAAIAPLFTIPKIKNQEAEVRALAERHKELANVLGEN